MSGQASIVFVTDANAKRTREKIEELKRNYRFGKTEIYKRIHVGTFVQLLLQLTEGECGSESSPPQKEQEDPAAPKTAFQSLVTGVGELQVEPNGSIAPILEDSPFLLLDVRDKDEFEKAHIVSAFNYPHTLLSRSDNYQIKEMHLYRNKEGKIVIIYDEDERTAPRVATVLVQRGFDNMFLLTGGLGSARRLFPEGLTTGGASDDANNRFLAENLSHLAAFVDKAVAEATAPTKPAINR